MSNTVFQDRLRRINASAQQRMPPAAGHAPERGAKKANHAVLAVGAILMAIGIQMVKHAYDNYDAIVDNSQLGTAGWLGLAGVAALLISAVLITRAVPGKRPAAQSSVTTAPSRSQPSKGGPILFSLLGFAFGAISCFYMFLSATAQVIGTETARTFMNGGFLIALALVALSLLLGFIGLFLRRYALWRVPIYFVCGAILTYATVRILKVNLLEWEQFVTLLS
ncbi:MAG: hypothetical protein AAGK82_07160 [Pseudomonadota bacterium]